MGEHLGLRDELSDFLACVKWCHFYMDDPPVGPPRRLQNLIMLLQDLPETCEVQVLQRHGGGGGRGRERTNERIEPVKTINNYQQL